MNEHQIVKENCHKLAKLLARKGSVSEEALFSAVLSPTYAHNLFTCKDTPVFLERLLSQPPYKQDAGRGCNDKFFEEAEIFLTVWEKSLKYQEQKESYEKKYGTYFKAKDKETVPCKPCAEIHPDDFREVYLDHNATTPIRQEIGELLADYYSGKQDYANPSSNTAQGCYISSLIQDARRKVANCLSAVPEEITFTGSGSEANNLAIKGIALRHPERKGHLITSKVEHSSVLAVMKYLETLGFSVTYLDVDKYGMVEPELVSQAIRKDTILVSIMAVNNEVGTINPLNTIGRICREWNIPFMVDAIQAFGKIPLNPKEMGISLLTFSGHKIYAPKGIGGLYVEKGITLVPLVHGGGQEAGLRSGTEDVGSIIALGKAAELSQTEMETETKRLLGLREFFLAKLKKIEPGFIVNGSLEYRSPNNLSIGFPQVDSGALLRSLNRIGVSVSVSSACSAKKMGTSHVLEAIGVDTKNYAAIRFGFGLQTTKGDLEYLFRYLPRILQLIKSKVARSEPA